MSKIKGNKKSVDTSFLAAGSEGLVAMPDGEPTVEVRIRLLQPYIDWCESFFETANASVLMAGGRLDVTLEEFLAYVKTLVAARVDYVRGRRAVVGPTEIVRVPTFIHVTLQGIGEVFSEDQYLWLIPEHDILLEEMLSPEQMISVSNRLSPLDFVGYQMAMGYDRDKRGAYDLMAMHYIIERAGVYSHDAEVELAFAPVAYFLGLQQVQVLMGERIRVAEDVTLKTRLRALTRVDVTKRAS